MPAEERKLATVLFADLVGSTELAGGQDPERVRAMLDRFYDAMAVEVERAGGTVEKFVGDAVMAAFGAPAAHEDDAERALHVALAMHRRLGELFGDARALSLMRPRGVGGLEPVFVGRERELDLLRALFGRVLEERQPRIVTVVGDAGVGKRRVLCELWQRLSERSPQPVLRAGRCLSYGEGITYWPLGEVLREHFAIHESESPASVAARFADREGLGFTLGLPPPDDMHPLTVRERIHNAWLDLLQSLVDDRPVVLLIEDLHWAEPELCALLQGVTERVAGPLLAIDTARPEGHDRHIDWRSD